LSDLEIIQEAVELYVDEEEECLESCELDQANEIGRLFLVD
jgi:hypothetical protein